jgi:hypothetical protein
MAKRGSKRVKRVRAAANDVMGPTPEQMRGAEYVLEDVTDKGRGGASIKIGKAYRRKSMLVTLAEQGYFNDEELKALSMYRHCALRADRSPLRDSLLRHMPTGSSDGVTIGILNAIRMTDDCERAAGSLRDILRAVIVDDVSLSQWAASKGGSIEKCRDRKGTRVCTMEPTDKALAIAKMEIKVAAHRVQAEIAA